MGYQALLFCPDEKLARVLTQVFSELDFSVDPVHEPFAAVKQLMAKHYDAVVVDCDNEQNASLLFRSARNSSSNQSSLAFAVVEGQTGVAKAYRIGANLVLTKPINVEQAKGTLRIARGLLRKGSDAAAAGTVAATAAKGMAAAAAAGSSSATGAPPVAESGSGWNDLATVSTTAGGAAQTITVQAKDHSAEDRSSLTSNGAVNSGAAVEQKQAGSRGGSRSDAANSNADSTTGANGDSTRSLSKSDSSKTASASLLGKNTAAASSSVGSAAAAVAPAKEGATSAAQVKPAPEKQQAEKEKNQKGKSAEAKASVANTSSAPSFGGLSEGVPTGSGLVKKILIAAAVILALAALSYFSDGKLSKFGNTRPEPAPAPQGSSQSAPVVRPMSSPETAPETSQPGVASTATHSLSGQNASANGTAAGDTTDLARSAAADDNDGEAQTKAPRANKRGAAPVMVNSQIANSQIANSESNLHTSRAKLPAQAEESAPPAPATLALTSANDGQLSGLMTSASLDVSKPSLATVKVSQGVSQGLLIKRVQPKYPQAALAVHAQGAVEIEATINKEGNVTNPKVLNGNPLLARAALDAVRQWRYKPYYLDGSPVEIQTQITIHFKSE